MQSLAIQAALRAFPAGVIASVAEYDNYNGPAVLGGDKGSSWVVAESTSASEIIFGSLGPMCHDMGWCVFPQQRHGRRLPGIFRREVIKWGLYQEERPAAELVDRWSKPLFNENVALILGPVSGNTFALDIDVRDWDFASAVERIAKQTLGPTAWKRVGNAPKRALFYRTETAAELPANISRIFACDDGTTPSPHGLEILSSRKTMTIYGRHHETFSRFNWGSGSMQPLLSRPSDVPVVRTGQIEEFLAAVQKFRPFVKGCSGFDLDLSFDVDPDGTINRPRISSGGDWVEEDGLVTDGREKFMFAIVSRTVRANAGLAQTEDGQRQLAAIVADEFRRKARLDGRWSNPDREILGKVRNAAGAVADGRVTAFTPRSRKIVKTKAIAPAVSVISDGCRGSLSWLPPASERGEIKDVMFSDTRCPDADLQALQISATATETVERITRETRRRLGAFFAAVADDPEAEHPTTHAIIAPTGAGKTHMLVEALDEFRDGLNVDAVIDEIAAGRVEGDEPAQTLMMQPSYRNLGETAKKASDAGLKVIEWIGKARSAKLTGPDRCIKGDEVAEMQKAGRNNAVLCEKPHPEFPDDSSKNIRCSAYDPVTGKWSCRFKNQSEEAAKADLILAVHAYISCPIPEVMKAARAVVIDESFHGQLIKSHRFSDSVLLMPRRKVAFRTKTEKGLDRNGEPIPGAKEIAEEDFSEAREEIAGRVHAALRAGVDPVRWFLVNDKLTVAQKSEMLDRTIALLSRVMDADDITPVTPLWKIRQLCSGPERTSVHEETKFWRLIRERVDLDTLALLDIDGNPKTGMLPARLPSALRDGRILWQRGPSADAPGEIRISWVSAHNFPEHHILVLDASADKSLLARVLDRTESEIVCEPMDAMLRVRTVHVTGKSLSKTSLLPRKSDTESLGAYKSKLTTYLRQLISHSAAMYPEGGIAVCAPQSLVAHLNDGWSSPERIHWMHYGNTRGFNFAEKCSAAIAIGCLNPSIQQLDDIVAALAHGDEIQEPLRDPHGPHAGDDVELLYKEDTVRLRNGHTMTVSQMATEGHYSQMALRQIRQEEHLQFLGRLRPVRRDEITDFINVGSYIPPSLIVDEVVDFDDLLSWIGNAVEVAREHQSHIGAGDRKEEVRAARKFSKILEATETKRNFFEIAAGGEVLYVPAHTPATVDRFVEEGYEITHAPAIGTMTDLVAPRCSYSDEVRLRDLALAAAEADGWSAEPGSRIWTREMPGDFDPEKTKDTPPTALDVAVLAQHYHTILRRREAAAVAETPPIDAVPESSKFTRFADDAELQKLLEKFRTEGA